MDNDRRLKPAQEAAILYLWRLAAHRAGYRICGVRGWAHLTDVEEAVRRALWDQLSPLSRRGFLDRQDVRAPTRVRPVWIYRITERGMLSVHRLVEPPYPPVPKPRDRCDAAVYAPSRQRGALLLLRAAYEDPGVPERFNGRGWLTGRELGARVEARNRARTARERDHGASFYAVDGTDLRWLVGTGLAERRDDPERPKVVWWRVTELGRSVRLLEWKPIYA